MKTFAFFDDDLNFLEIYSLPVWLRIASLIAISAACDAFRRHQLFDVISPCLQRIDHFLAVVVMIVACARPRADKAIE